MSKFARLRPFPINHSLLTTIPRVSVVKKFTRLRATSPEFAFLFFVFSNFRVFVIGLPLQFAESEVTRRITKTRKYETTKKCIPLCERSLYPAQMTDQRPPVILFTSLPSLSSVQNHLFRSDDITHARFDRKVRASSRDFDRFP